VKLYLYVPCKLAPLQDKGKTKNRSGINMKNFIIKGSLITLLASSSVLTGLATFAHAEGTTSTTEITESIDLQTNTDVQAKDDIEGSFETGVKGSTDADVDSENSEISLLPGDFFYFFKVMIEKLQVSLTFDDKEKAILLAEFAAERIAEAEALLEQGNEELALDVIEKAVLTIQNSEEFGVAVENDASATTEQETVVEEEATEENLEETEIPVDEGETTREEDTSNEDESVEESDDSLEAEIAQNIIALTLAMEKVRNPVAKAALARNIERSLAKIEARLAKLEANTEDEIHELDKESEVEIVADAESEIDTETDLKTVALETSSEVDTTIDAEVALDANQVISPAVLAAKETHNGLKIAAKAVKEEAKEQKKAGLEIAKEKRQEAKEKQKEAKGKRAEAKVNIKVKHNEQEK
jgi:hypothetical protein